MGAYDTSVVTVVEFISESDENQSINRLSKCQIVAASLSPHGTCYPYPYPYPHRCPLAGLVALILILIIADCIDTFTIYSQSPNKNI